MFALSGICAFLVPIVYSLRYRYYLGQFHGAVYQRRFQVGWPLTTVGAEMMSIGTAICAVLLLRWPPLGQDRWITLDVVIFSLSVLCLFVGFGVIYWIGDPFLFLRERSRRTSPDN
jgi:hypothetical protein